MTYRGKVQNGVIVLDDSPTLPEGASVQVELAEDSSKPPPGSKQAVLSFLDRSTGWEGPPGELERLLAEVQEMREEDLLR